MEREYKTLIDQIEYHSLHQPDKDALIMKKDHLTYSELNEAIKLVGTKLKNKGINRGDRVLILAVSKPQMVAAYLGIQYIGAVVVPVDKNATPESIYDIYSDTKAAAVIIDKPLKGYEDSVKIIPLKDMADHEDIENKYAEYIYPSGDDIAELIYTTGTTGKPKGIMLTYDSIYHSMLSVAEGLGIMEDERYLLPLPVNHAYAVDSLRSVLYKGATVILQNGFLFADDTRRNIEELKCTAMSMVPSAIDVLKTQFGDKFSDILGQLRFIKLGAGQFGISLQRSLSEMLPDTVIYNGWGSSETSTAFLLNVSEKVKDGQDIPSIGRSVKGVEIAFLDEDGSRLESTSYDNPGRLAVKSPCIMKGYWNNEELTLETVRDGFILTSDIAYQDDNGYVYLLGRADDIINVGGEKISPLEVENIAEQCEGVRECACIGVPDDGKGFDMIPVLFVASDSAQYENVIEDLKSLLAARLEKYKQPREYIRITELPRNRMKKIDRKALRKYYEDKKADKDNAGEIDNPVLQALYTRRSIRSYTDKKIDRDILDKILKAGYYAPSGHNMQTWRFTVLQGEDKISRFKETVAQTAKANGLPFYGFENPNAVVIVSNDKRALTPCEDASAAIENILLAAHSLGLGGVWIGVLTTLRDAEPVRSLLDSYGIPDTHVIYGIVNLGYPLAAGRLLAKKTNVVHYV